MHDIFKGDLDLNKELAKFEDTLRENFKFSVYII